MANSKETHLGDTVRTCETKSSEIYEEKATVRTCKAKSSEIYEQKATWYDNRNSTPKPWCCDTKHRRCNLVIKTLKLRNWQNHSAFVFVTVKSCI